MATRFWACDSDLELVTKKPIPFVVARLDFKLAGDGITFAEAIAYQHYLNAPVPYHVPIYIVEATTPFTDDAIPTDTHRFNVTKIESLDYRPEPPTYIGQRILTDATWKDLYQWEELLRRKRQSEMVTYLCEIRQP
jgi:hypothetical protein